MTKSSVSRRQSKPKKPYPEFPLSIRQSGQWFKKFKGKFHYFGAIDDWQSAFEKYEREWPHIIQGEIVPPARGLRTGLVPSSARSEGTPYLGQDVYPG